MNSYKRIISLSFLAFLLCLKGTYASETQSGKKNVGTWNQIYYEGLMRFYQKDYDGVINMVQSAVQSRQPGDGAQNCLLLMRLAFCREYDSHVGMQYDKSKTPHYYSKSALEYFKRLEAKEESGIADLVILASVKDSYVYHVQVLKILNQIINSDSPWCHWAFWKRTHTIYESRFLRYSLHNYAPEVVDGDTFAEYSQYVNFEPGPIAIELIKSSSAEAYLQKYPNCYMRNQLLHDLDSYLLMAHRLLVDYKRTNIGLKDSNLNSERQQELDTILKGLGSLMDGDENVPGWITSNKLEIKYLLYHGTDDGDRFKIPRFLKGIQMTEPKGTLPEHVAQWLETLNISPREGK